VFVVCTKDAQNCVSAVQLPFVNFLNWKYVSWCYFCALYWRYFLLTPLSSFKLCLKKWSKKGSFMLNLEFIFEPGSSCYEPRTRLKNVSIDHFSFSSITFSCEWSSILLVLTCLTVRMVSVKVQKRVLKRNYFLTVRW